MGGGFIQFPMPGVYQPNGGGPRFGPTFDGQFSSGLTTHPYTNGLLDLTNIFQQIIYSGGTNFTGGGIAPDPFSGFGQFTGPGFNSPGSFISPSGFVSPAGAFITPGQNPFFNATGGGFTPTGYGGMAFPLPGVYQPNSGGPRFGPTFDGLFSSGLTTHPYTNGILDGVNQFQTVITMTGPVF